MIKVYCDHCAKEIESSPARREDSGARSLDREVNLDMRRPDGATYHQRAIVTVTVAYTDLSDGVRRHPDLCAECFGDIAAAVMPRTHSHTPAPDGSNVVGGTVVFVPLAAEDPVRATPWWDESRRP